MIQPVCPPSELDPQADLDRCHLPPPPPPNVDFWEQAYAAILADPTISPLLQKYQAQLRQEHQTAAGSEPSTDATESPGHGAATRLAEMQTLASERLDRLARSRLCFTVGPRQFAVREQVQRVVKLILAAKGVISSAVATDPAATVAWAGIMVALPVSMPHSPKPSNP